MWGGPSQLDTFDMKPDAPDTVRSPYKPIATTAPGIQVCEHLPEMAKRMEAYKKMTPEQRAILKAMDGIELGSVADDVLSPVQVGIE